MNPPTLDDIDALAAARAQSSAKAEADHRALLNGVVAVLADGDGVINVAALALRAGVSRATIYNELDRRGIKRGAA